MNITPISSNYNPNFGITSKVRIHLKDGTTALLNVTGNTSKKGSVKITKITCDIMSKGKSLDTKVYKNKNGFDDEEIAAISDKIGENAKEPYTVINKIYDAIIWPTVDYNA